LITHEEPAHLETQKTIARAKLDQAYKIIEDCAQALANRPKYFIHVLFNRALVHIYRGPDHYGLARECVEQLFGECRSNPRWLANVFVLKSYLERCAGNVDTALADAIKAYSHAGNHLPVKIEALLARGQAQLARNKLPAARADVEKALHLNDGANLKWEALGNLLLVEMALQQNQPTKACEKLLHISELMPSIRYGSLINQYRQLSAQLDHVQNDYLITSNTEVLHYKKFEEDLQRWLLEKALREDTNVTRIAKRLQVTKKTIYMWLERYKIKP
jgi:DNA-binding NtrC family response regulator